MAAEITLPHGFVALVSGEDYDRVAQWRWSLGAGYAHRVFRDPHSGRSRTVGMHRFILGDPQGKVIHHRDGDGLNNQRGNLEICTQRENSIAMHVPAYTGPYMTCTQISKLLGLTVWQVQQLWWGGFIPKAFPGRILFRREDVERFAAQHEGERLQRFVKEVEDRNRKPKEKMEKPAG